MIPMKIIKPFFKFLPLITLVCFLLSCHGGPYKVESFLIKVDSIHVPIALISNTPFDIDFFGTIGTDGCHSFVGFNHTLNNQEIMIEAMGSYDYQADLCPTVMVYLNGHKLNMTVPIPGIYIIKIKQPDNTSLLKEITVK